MYLLADIGGTKTRLAVSQDLESFEQPLIYDTPKDYNTFLNKVVEVKNELIKDRRLTAAILGITGTLDPQKEHMLFSPHLENWEGKNVNVDLKKKLEIQNLTLRNDTELVGLGEAVYGPGANFKLVTYLTISTGIGGVKVENKKIDESRLSTEPGHQIIDADNLKTFEDLCSSTGINRTYNKKPQELDSYEIGKFHKELAVGIFNTTLFWSTEIAIIGGGLVNHGIVRIEKLIENLNEFGRFKDSKILVEQSKLGDLGGIYGAMWYAKSVKKV